MSNPYGTAGQPDPYGQQPSYGAYGAGPDSGSADTDAVSIVAFVSGLLCCAPVGLVLGIVGLRRTKGGRRKGRWAAVTGLVLGLLGLLAWAGFAVLGVLGVGFFDSIVTADDAEAGQCVQVDEDDSDGVLLREKECGEEHNGEIVAVVDVTDENVEDVNLEMANYCFSQLSADQLATLDADPELELKGVALEGDPESLESGDTLACYIQKEGLTERVL